MKKIVLSALVASSALMAEVITVLPYAGTVHYDKDNAKSVKNTATVVGGYASVGNLNYLLEMDYTHFDSQYKDPTLSDLKQDDITLAYSRYFENFMVKIGDHYISSSDAQLGNGNTIMTAVEGYQWSGYNKLSVGLEGYYSRFAKGHDENYLTEKSISITQLTPYVSWYQGIDHNWYNTLGAKINYEMANDYVKGHYFSYELSDTLGYQNMFLKVGMHGGEMRTGVTNGGLTLVNTLDLMKREYNAKLGYYVTKNSVLSLTYTQRRYQEYVQGVGLAPQGSSSALIASASYSF